MEKKYSPINFENLIFKHWESLKIYKHKNQTKKPNFCIVLPPPNVTGSLHLGHAWDGTIQDAIIRFKKLNGFNTYWVAGKDHAGIATQTTFEKYLLSIGKKRTDYKRKDFVSELKSWVKKNSDNIDLQWKKMGFLLDYDNPKFTLDISVSKYVNSIFKNFYNQKLVYKKKTLVNWDVKLQTAISDIEVIKKETKSKLYTFKFKFFDSSKYLEVSTTRPETMYADTCLVVNPKDSRYFKYIGKEVINPASKNKIEVIADDYVDPKYGTGVMKCTPAHDFNDYKIGNKYHQKYQSCFNLDGTMNDLGKEFEGLDRLKCREKLIKKLQKEKLLSKVEDEVSSIGYSERTNEIVEPLLSSQWFISMKPLAKEIITKQKSKKGVNVFPKHFNKSLITWLENIEDWCISRQLWWGHQIPAWYHIKTKEIVVEKPKDLKNYIQEEAVFDTWFSSSLWPFVTLDFNQNKTESKLFFPTNVLVTAYDIIFFWVARMLMISLKETKKMPFKDLFIHGLIRDEKNQKLSKSLGNFVDLFELCEKFGVDALRLFLLSNSTIGQDLIYSEQKVVSASNFLNKLWNIAIFVSLNYKKNEKSEKLKNLHDFDYWIINKTNNLIKEFKQDFENYNYVVAIKKLVDFVKNDFSKIYIDINRYRLKTDNNFAIVSKEILKSVLILLHPICCFITEKIYLELYQNKKSILLEKWPFFKYYKETNQIDDALLILENIRNWKWQNKLTRSTAIKIEIYYQKKIEEKLLIDIFNYEKVTVKFFKKKFSKKTLLENQVGSDVKDFVIVYEKLNPIIDSKMEAKIIENLKFEIKRSRNILSNQGFLKKAPKELIKKEEIKLKINLEKLNQFNK